MKTLPLPIYSKIFGKVIYKRMYDYLEINNRKFGFRADRPASHALINTSRNMQLNINAGNYAGGIFTDLQKAFDT